MMLGASNGHLTTHALSSEAFDPFLVLVLWLRFDFYHYLRLDFPFRHLLLAWSVHVRSSIVVSHDRCRLALLGL